MRGAVQGCATAALVAVLAGCSSAPPADDGRATAPPTGSASGASPPVTSPTTPPSQSPTQPPTQPPPIPRADPDLVRVRTATQVVRHLAGQVGPRPATGPEFRQSAAWVEQRLAGLGYAVRRQPFAVPAGVSWGVPVRAGRSVNLVATAPDVDLNGPHLVVGAHLDTVPQAPGAEDNASGVGALVAVAEAVVGRRTRLPVAFVVFGAEEPRGPTDDDHHYGSRHYVAELRPAQRSSLRGMVALDRVGVGTVMPVCSAVEGTSSVQRQLLRAARTTGVPTIACSQNRASDHWSFVREGLPGARLGSTSYAGYHSAGDTVDVVEPAQLRRAARITVAWLAGRPNAERGESDPE